MSEAQPANNVEAEISAIIKMDFIVFLSYQSMRVANVFDACLPIELSSTNTLNILSDL
jgi:hypothetical protein